MNTDGAFDNVRFYPHADLDPPLPEPEEEEDSATNGEKKNLKGLAGKTCLDNLEP
jgi:hypothetical protein